MADPKIIDLKAVFVHQTSRAVLVRTDEGANSNQQWFPKSVVEMDPKDPIKGAVVELTGPEDFFIEKGFV